MKYAYSREIQMTTSTKEIKTICHMIILDHLIPFQTSYEARSKLHKCTRTPLLSVSNDVRLMAGRPVLEKAFSKDPTRRVVVNSWVDFQKGNVAQSHQDPRCRVATYCA